jgi:hypothetical protein
MNQEIHAPNKPLLVAVVTAPRRTMRWMLDHPERRQSFAVVIAAVLSTYLRDLDRVQAGRAIEALGLSASMVMALAVIAVMVCVSAVFFFAFSAAAVAAGRLLGASGTFGEVRTALAWGTAPQVFALIYRLPIAIFFPHLVRRSVSPEVNVGSTDLVFSTIDFSAGAIVLALVELAVLVWYLVVGSRTLAEAQKISSMRGFANLLMAVVLPFVALMVVMLAGWLAVTTT